jgi:hypothetical protein
VTDGKAMPFPNRIPLVIGVTGHRDLLDADIGRLKQDVAAVFERLKTDYLGRDAETPMIVLSALAEGADQLVAQVALDLGAALIAPLPLPLSEYRRDFVERPIGADAIGAFERLLEKAIATPQMPLAPGNEAGDIEKFGPKRDLQYREANLFIARHCHVLIALWDGDTSDLAVGGTAEMVAYKRNGIPLKISGSARAGIDGIEIGPVIHVLAPRHEAHPRLHETGIHLFGHFKGAPPTGLAGRGLHLAQEFLSHSHLFGFLLSKRSSKPTDEEARTLDAWSDFNALSTLTRRFNAEAAKLDRAADGPAALATSLDRLFEDPADKACLAAAKDRALAWSPRWCAEYATADILARQWQEQFWFDWKVLFGLGFVAFACFEVAAHLLPGHDYLLLVYSVAIVGIFGFLLRARVNQHQEQFLDYRALAEALRVAIFWKLAGFGIRSGPTQDAARRDGAIADAYPIKQPSELAWVKTVLQSLELLDTIDGSVGKVRDLDADAYKWIRRVWVGGQRRYFELKGEAYSRKAERSEARSLMLLLLSPIVAAVIFVQYLGLIHFHLPDWIRLETRDLLIFITGMVPGLAALMVGLSQQLALMAQARQYDRMRVLFGRAHELLPETFDPASAPLLRDLYYQLGVEAINEHAEWVSIYRQRPLRPPQA